MKLNIFIIKLKDYNITILLQQFKNKNHNFFFLKKIIIQLFKLYYKKLN